MQSQPDNVAYPMELQAVNKDGTVEVRVQGNDDSSNRKHEVAEAQEEVPGGINFWAPRELRLNYRDYVAEFLGNFVLIYIAKGAVITSLLVPDLGLLGLTIGIGVAVTMALYVSLGISGGHLNSAVTVGNAVFGDFPWRKVPGYIAAQMLGAFLGAACAYGVFADLLKAHGGGELTAFGEKGTAWVFAMYPRDSNGIFSCIFGEFICTAMLLFCVCGIFDPNNSPAKGHEPLAVGALVFAMVNNFGLASPLAMNPSLDFGPRVFGAILLGGEVFSHANYYFWVPLVVPFFGAILGLFLYKYFLPH
ncbi:aquaglyceroporin (small solute channel),putative [Trypanosoma brucei gambiense DAL972]|uniref:Aquaglyceroporin (Small solute channel),putative n=1 Tax=Trypanosoma brucei gambiense (strain MHOM/CI/86/DAL972) TaxID=679716 RepID=C9ZZZ3_TRYB9|nr:aquaglyceroporin (small solute channel),putative [Trypanosoma brucei gambiense DAL972]CBH16551.1 aquaglyceroporin (small solute channel),putative [Trypanosoma brucei gambiense DAL972]|eukprot:XP_011778815.1 aquaglyceroporin (small solute channel),putative [Trypanosoma brucei gambiense DAL972]